MTGMRRHFGLLAILSALSLAAGATSVAAAPQDAGELFKEGVTLLEQGDDEGALEKFTEVLASDPSNEEAYELWKSTEYEVWLQMLVKGGQYELVAKRLIDRAKLGRSESADDEGAIRDLLAQVQSDDVLERARAIRALAANHGEYAVRYMLPTLADENANDRRVLFMQALTEMGTDVVLPLVAVLGSDDAYLRRNVALTLGYIGDPRAGAALTWLAFNDPDEGVQRAAGQAAHKVGSQGDALKLFLALGDDYYHQRATVLRAVDYSDVVWSWGDGDLVATPVPRCLYADELSKNAYYGALAAAPESLDARAGLARAYVAQQVELAYRTEAGQDVSGLEEQVAKASIAISATGIAALDRALVWAVSDTPVDTTTAIGLIRAIGDSACAPVPGLHAALVSSEAALSGEAAVALGRIAHRTRRGASPEVVAALGTAAGRDIMRIGVVIDGQRERGEAIKDALDQQGLLVNFWDRGAMGLALLKRVPGVDVIVVSDELPDLTVDQVLGEIAEDERPASTPVVMVTESEDWSDRVAATITGAADAGSILEVIAEGLDGDRARADELSARAASVLAGLSLAGGNVASALDDLTGTLASRGDSVTLPAMTVLATVGTADAAPALMGVLADEARSEAARIAAADAIAQIASREALSGPPALVVGLEEVVGSEETPLPIRVAAIRALSSMTIPDEVRAAMTAATRVDVAGE